MGRELLQRLIRLFGYEQERAVDVDELELDAEVGRKARKDQALTAVIGEDPLDQIDWLIAHGFDELIKVQKRIDREHTKPHIPERSQQLASMRQVVVIEWVAAETVDVPKPPVRREPLLTYEYIACSKVIHYWIRS
ncbi:hypothetical protein [Planococcus lenghuensis]|uniref:Uncharacterized protein n=1 Tax=Planococcus lenghuensis TaxID=2213202 RepID=A0A1Q2KWP2_9BACL|nr:hypothetical protein [Planococcus lenghuensis]AQQ52227.1 hypothetical protein B0X71_03265 [Planococcus lenghuensis]